MATSVANEVVIYTGTDGVTVGRSSGTGPAFLTSGVLSVRDPASTLFYENDFLSGVSTTGNVGGDWTTAGGVVTNSAGVANHPGIVNRTCSTTGNAIGYTCLRGNPTTGLFLPAELFDMTFIVKMAVNDSNTVFRCGMSSDPNSLTATHGIYVEKAAADTQWFGCNRASNSQNRTTALATTDTNFHRFRIWRSDASTISYSIDGGTAATQTSTIPTAALMPFVHISNNNAAEDKNYDLDYFSLRITGMTR